MSDKGDVSGFSSLVEPAIRKWIENIDSPFVWAPLALFALCVLAYPITNVVAFPYLAIAFVIIAFGADWYGRARNRKTPPLPNPVASTYRDDVFRFLAQVQAKAVRMLEKGRIAAAQVLTERNLKAVDDALQRFPDDAEFHALLGYTLKDMYQASRQMGRSTPGRPYLDRARKSFERALQCDPNSASAHNGLANVLFFEGRLDDAIREHDKAIALAGGDYPAAAHDKDLVTRVKSGEIAFTF